MRSRLARLGLLGVGVLALLGSTTPPAQAHTDAVATFQAVATLDGGLDYPCILGPDPDGTLTGLPCPPTPITGFDLPLQGQPVNTNTHVEWTGNRRGVSILSTVCTSEGVQGLNKPSPGPFVHTCTIATGQNPNGKQNYVRGHCGLSGGQVYVTLTDSLGQTYDADIHFTSTATVINFTGHWRKRGVPSQHGKIVGTNTALAAGEPLTTTNSCTNKTARIFNLTGSFAVTQDPLLLPPV